MALKKRKPTTWLEVAIAQGGIRTGVRALTWAHQWVYVQVALGHDPTADEVAEWWGTSRRTAFREQAAFRECFPNLDTPAAVFDSPEVMAKVRQSVATLNDLDATKRAKSGATDLDIIQAGLSPST